MEIEETAESINKEVLVQFTVQCCAKMLLSNSVHIYDNLPIEIALTLPLICNTEFLHPKRLTVCPISALSITRFPLSIWYSCTLR